MQYKVILRLMLVTMALGTMLALAGCGGLLDPGPPPAVYVLSPAMPGKGTGEHLNRQLAIVQPTANDMLSTNRIITRYATGEVRAWKASAWASSVPAMMQGLLIQAFENDGRVTAIPYDAIGFNADYRMVSDIRQFNVVLDDDAHPDYVRVQLSVHLIELKTGKSLGSMISDCRAGISGNDLNGALAAFNQATSESLAEVCAWAIGVLRANRS